MKKILCIIVGMLCLLPLGAKVKLPAIIGNDMVLQQNTNVNLWGWATRSRKITVRTSWDNKNYTTTSASMVRGKYRYRHLLPVVLIPLLYPTENR